mgnify:CR=1 FL=1
MNTVKLVYDPVPRTQSQKESITFLAILELERAGIYAHQLSASVIQFDSARDLTIALLLLAASDSFRACVLD